MSLLRWRSREREFSTELQSHLDMHIADNVRAGMTPAEARRQALIALGGVEQTREQFRDALSFAWVGAVLQDIHFGWRAMWRSTGFTVLVIATLAVGLAATNTAFTLANAVLLRDLPFDDPDRLVSVRLSRPQDEDAEMSHPDFRDVQRATQSFAGIAAYSVQTMTVGDDDRAPERFIGAYLSANTFSLLGIAPTLGRDFEPADEMPGAPAVVILGERIWKSRYGGDSAVLGRVIRVNARPATVIGVMPEGFEFPLIMPIWQPLTAMPDVAARGRHARFLRTVARLGDGVSVDAATAEMSSIAGVLARDYPETNEGTRPGISRFRSGIGAPWYVVFGALMTAVGLLLLVGCANVANLLLARSVQRAREMAIRASLGATRWRIVRQLLVESAVLAVTAGLLAIPLSAAALRLFITYVAQFGIPFWMDFSMNATVFAFLALVCLGTAIVFGLAPALHLSQRSGMVNPSSDRTGTAGVWAHRWSAGLVVAEVVLTVVLIAGAASMMRHLVLGTNVNQRLDLEGTVTLNLDLPAHTYATSGQRADFYRRLEERLTATRRTMPVAIGSAAPFMGSGRHQFSASAGLPVAGEKWPLVEAISIGEWYFETIGVPMRRGRSLADEDAGAGQAAVVVNDALVERFFPSTDAVGRDVTLIIDESPRRFTVVGVVPTFRQGDSGQGGVPIVYMPYLARPVRAVVLLARSSDARAAANMLREDVGALDPDLPLFDVRTLEQVLRELLWPNRVFGGMFVVFATIAILVAVVGVYGVVAHTTAQRTKEIGIRMALGASRERLWWTLMRSKIAQVGLGIALGIVAAFVLLGLMGGLLVGRFGQDPLTLAISGGFLLLVATVSMLWPIWRATSRSPVAALRYE